jgi:hypothetical protein
MQHQEAATLNGGIHGAGYPVTALHPHFPQLAFQWADMGQSYTLRSEALQHLSNVQEPGFHVGRKRQQFRLCQRVHGHCPIVHSIAILRYCLSHHAQRAGLGLCVKHYPGQIQDMRLYLLCVRAQVIQRQHCVTLCADMVISGG